MKIVKNQVNLNLTKQLRKTTNLNCEQCQTHKRPHKRRRNDNFQTNLLDIPELFDSTDQEGLRPTNRLAQCDPNHRCNALGR